MIRDHLDVHSFFCWRFLALDCQDWHIAYCCFIIWQLFSNMLEYWWFGTCIFSIQLGIVTPTDELHHFSEG